MRRRCSEYEMTSDVFRNWTETAEVLCADEQMPVPGDEPAWCPAAIFIPRRHDILLPTAYYHWREDAFPPNIDVSLATSRDGVNWWQPLHREPFLRLGPDGSAASGMLFANPWPIPVGDEIWIYYAGIGRDHRQELKDPSLTGIFLARLRHDGVDNWPSESNEYLPMTHPWC